MKQGYEALTEKEKQTLRLLLAGHDAKSMARHLGLSVHTVNERLSDARRKLSATSSKEAARRLREAEAGSPDPLGDRRLGNAKDAPAGQSSMRPDAASTAKHNALWVIGGLAMISFAIALLALSPSTDRAGPSAATAAPAAQSSAAQAAQQWLQLVDSGQWEESWAATAQSFRSLNTVAAWQSASESARVPLGRVVSRSFTSEESVPAPPRGHQVVRFRTDFANKAAATETLPLPKTAAAGGSSATSSSEW